jgi:hypothetical protein
MDYTGGLSYRPASYRPAYYAIEILMHTVSANRKATNTAVTGSKVAR